MGTSEKILEFIRQKGKASNQELQDYTGLSSDGVTFQLKKLKSRGLIVNGPKKTYILKTNQDNTKESQGSTTESQRITKESQGGTTGSQGITKESQGRTKESDISSSNIITSKTIKQEGLPTEAQAVGNIKASKESTKETQGNTKASIVNSLESSTSKAIKQEGEDYSGQLTSKTKGSLANDTQNQELKRSYPWIEIICLILLAGFIGYNLHKFPQDELDQTKLKLDQIKLQLVDSQTSFISSLKRVKEKEDAYNELTLAFNNAKDHIQQTEQDNQNLKDQIQQEKDKEKSLQDQLKAALLANHPVNETWDWIKRKFNGQ